MDMNLESKKKIYHAKTLYVKPRIERILFGDLRRIVSNIVKKNLTPPKR